MKSAIAREPPEVSKHVRRNEGAISLILEGMRTKLTEAVNTEGFWGTVDYPVEIVDQDIIKAEPTVTQLIKLK